MSDLRKPEMEPGDLSRDLIAQARAGSEGAFELIYRTHVGHVYAVCLRILGDLSRAEDMTQQVFIRSWAKLDSFRGESDFGTWIHRIAVNEAISELKASKSIENSQTSLSAPRTESAYEPDKLQNMQMDLESAIAALPAGPRVVFVLHEIEGFNHEEIASSLGVTAGTTRTQLYRARTLLREALEKP